MSLFDRFTVIDPSRALLFRDLPALTACLDKGWRPVLKGAESELRRSLAQMVQLVASGWFPGWQAILAHEPGWRHHPVVITTAFQHLHVPFMADLLDHGLDATRPVRARQSPLTPVHLIIEGMGRQVNEPWSETRPGVAPLEERVRATCALLEAHGLDPYLPYPGTFIPENSGIEGHSIWTRALRYGRWDVAQRLMPSDWATVLAQPRGLEALVSLEQVIHGPMPDLDFEDEVDLLGNDSLTLREDLSYRYEQAWPVWQEVLTRWAEPLFEHLDWYALNRDQDWLRWPSLPLAVRQAYARAWHRPRRDGLTTYHLLALDSPDRAEARAVLAQLLADGGTPEGWTTLDMDGQTPADLWAMTWEVPSAVAMDLRQALASVESANPLVPAT